MNALKNVHTCVCATLKAEVKTRQESARQILLSSLIPHYHNLSN